MNEVNEISQTVETKYKPIPTLLYANYLRKLIDKFFKIIPLKEENSPTVDDYMESLILELIGAQDLVSVLNYNPQLLTLISTLRGLMLNDENYRSEIFKCIQIVKSLERTARTEYYRQTGMSVVSKGDDVDG
jgi:hypothetical protein